MLLAASRDSLMRFFQQTSLPRPLQNIFENGGDFAEIFEFKIADDAAESWLSGVTGTTESKLSVVIDKSKLSGFFDTAESVKINFCIWSSSKTLLCHGHRLVNFEFKYLGEFEVKCENPLGCETEA
jgi:hypothetical protein